MHSFFATRSRTHEHTIDSLWLAANLQDLASISLPSAPIGLCFESNSHLVHMRPSSLFLRLRELHVPKSVEVLGEGCFSSCSSLERVTFEAGSGLKRIEKQAFSGCSSLKALEVPKSVEVLGEQCFCSCSSLERVTFEAGSGLKRIEKEAFSRCRGLKGLEVPDGVSVIR